MCCCCCLEYTAISLVYVTELSSEKMSWNSQVQKHGALGFWLWFFSVEGGF